MKIRIIILLIALCQWSGFADASSAGIYGYSGNSSTCASCHSGGSYNYAASISGLNTLSPSTSSAYSFAINRSSGSSASGAGFNVSVTGGTLVAGGDSTRNGTFDELTHNGKKTNTSTNYTWSFNWSAPSTVGTYTMYGCGNPIDDTGGTGGDGGIACTSKVITVNSNPTAVNDPSITHTEDGGNDTISPLTNDSAGGSGDTKTLVGICSTGTAAASCTSSSHNPGSPGSLSVSGNNVIYTPASNYNGSFSFQYRMRDSFFIYDNATVTVTVSAQNDNPVITQGASTSVNMSEDSSPTPFSLTLNATDPDAGATFTWSILTQASNGTASASGSGSSKAIGYTPNSNYNGSDSFVVRVTDNTGRTDDITVNVNVASQNDTPVITQGASTSVNMSEDGSPDAFSLTLNATDGDAGATLTWSISSQGSNGTAAASGTGTSKAISYTPNANYNGSDSFNVRVTDNTGRSDTITVNVTISAQADSPIITQGASTSVNMSEDSSPTPFSLTLNATDADAGTTLTWSISSQGSNGTAAASGTGTSKAISYTPNANYNGSDSFNVRVTDNTGRSDTITVNVDVAAQADNPIITEGVSTSVNMSEDSSPTAFSLTLNATDADAGTTLTWSISSQGSNGTAAASGTGSSKAISYTPNANYNGSDSFVVQVSDGTGRNDTITVNVNIAAQADNPVITEGASTSVNMSEDSSPTAFSLTLNATDADAGTTLTWSISSQGSNGTAAASGTGSSKAISYTPNANYNGSDSFVVQVSDGTGRNDTITVNVNISANNDAPSISGVDTTLAFVESTGAQVLESSVSITDIDSSQLNLAEIEITTNYVNGEDVLAVPSCPGGLSCTYTPGASGLLTISGTALLSVYQSAIQSITYNNTSEAPSTSNRTVRARVRDTSGDYSSYDSMLITVASVEDPAAYDTPVYNRIGSGTSSSTSQTVIEDDTIQLQFAATDPEGVSTTFSLVSTTPTLTGPEPLVTVTSGGLLSWTPDGTRSSVQAVVGVNDNVGATPDNTFAITLNVSATNDPPVIAEGASTSVNMSEDATPTAFSLTLNASDFDGDTLTWSIQTQASNGTAAASGTGTSKAISYTPNANYNGADSFVVRVTDGQINDDITVNVSIAAQPDNPIITEGASTSVNMSEDSSPTAFSLTLNATDADAGTTLTWSISSQGSNGTAAASGTGSSKAISYTPNANYNGSDSFVVQVSDGTGRNDTITVNVNIAAQADDPVITQGASTSVNMSEDSSPTPFGLTLNATDVDAGTTLTWSISSQGSNGTAAASGTGTSKTIAYTPNANYNGSDSFNVRVTDNTGRSDTITVNVNIAAQADNPIITEGASTSVNMSEDSSPTAFSLTLNATDADAGTTLTWSISSQGSNGTAAASGTGSSKAITYTPTTNYNGSDSFVVQVTDNTGRSDTITVNVNIAAVNDDPVITEGASTSVNMSEDSSPTAFALTLNATDVDTSTTLTWSISSQASNGTASTSGTGTSKAITYSPNANYNGSDSFVVQVTDNGGLNDTITVNVSIAAQEDDPVITEGASTTVNMSEDSSPTPFSLTLNATDPDAGATFTWSISSQASNGTAAASGTGSSKAITYSPNANYNGADSFVVQLTDNTGRNDTITVNVNISALNDPPTFTSTPVLTATEDILYNYNVDATDQENQTLSYSLTANPAGMTIDPTSGLISWTPTEGVLTSGTVTVRVTETTGATTLSTDQSFTVTVTAVNDAPQITSTAPTSVIELVQYSYQTVFNDPDDSGTGLTFSLINAPAGMTVTPNTGLVTWTPGQNTAAVYNFTIQLEDGREDGAAPATEAVTLTVALADMDADTIADYVDNCPNTANTNQANNDGDAQGDACDSDDDNDGMPDTFEIANGLNPNDPSDAAGDLDQDGVSNLQEFLNGTNPTQDSVAPVITAPDMTVNATGLFTAVELSASAQDALDGQVAVTTSSNKGPFQPGRHTINWTAKDKANNTANLTQTINVNPIVSITRGQYVGEGVAVTAKLSLNGTAASYPVTVGYSVTGSAANPADHDLAASGTATFTTSQTEVDISFNTVNDALVESNETVIITLDSANNAVLGDQKQHTATIVGTQVAPELSLKATQNAIDSSAVYKNQGNITITASATDANGDTLSYDWSAVNTVTLNPVPVSTDTTASFDPSSLAAGVYAVVVSVSDGINTTTQTLNLILSDTPPTLSATSDTDNDGTDDVTEGIKDTDGDGVPDYKDAVSQANLLPTSSSTSSSSNMMLMETEAGLSLKLGASALGASNIGTEVTQQDIQSALKVTVSNDPDYTYVTNFYDFIIDGIDPATGQAKVVIPLAIRIPQNGVYRKYKQRSGWSAFVESATDKVQSAFSNEGACPPVMSSAYTDGLTPLADCIQLTISDGGPNDDDGTVNGTIVDPGAIGIPNQSTPVASTENAISQAAAAQNAVQAGGSSAYSRLFLQCLSLLAMVLIVRRKKQQ